MVSDLYTSQPVLSDWTSPAMGTSPKANESGKPLFENGEYLANVGQQCWLWPWHPDSTGGHCSEIPINAVYYVVVNEVEYVR